MQDLAIASCVVRQIQTNINSFSFLEELLQLKRLNRIFIFLRTQVIGILRRTNFYTLTNHIARYHLTAHRKRRA